MENRIKFDKARFSVLTSGLIRMEYSSTGEFDDGATQVVQNRDFGPVKFDNVIKEGTLEILTDALHLYYQGGEFSQASLYADFHFADGVFSDRWRFGLENPFNLGGTCRTLDTVDGEIELEDGVIAVNGQAYLPDDSLALSTDGQHLEQRKSEIDGYLFAYGSNYRAAIQDFYRLTGATPKLPRFALGNWWSRFYEYSEVSYLALMDKFAEKEIPLSVSVIDMDWHRVKDLPSRFGGGWTGYSWNHQLFPDPKRFMTELHQRGLKITLNDHPADGIRAFEASYPAMARRLGLNQAIEEAARFNFDDPEFRASFFEEVHRPIEADGADFWWIDWQQGQVSESGADPLWLLNHYQFQDAQRNSANIILSRYAGPGSHRYPIGFSGDTVVSWASLNFQPYFTSTASNIGYSWWSHDIGGHMRGKKDAELSLRWLEFGVFSPILRLHSTKSEFTGKEPWHFELTVEVAMTKFLRLRHAFIPYLYTANLLTAEKGLTLIEPMYYEYPRQNEAYTHLNQYRFGTELMVAPITQKMNTEMQMGRVSVWFPSGVWYDFFSGQKYIGDCELAVYREISEIPVFAKAGAIIPLDKNPLAKEEVPSELNWYVFPGASGDYQLLEDDNITSVKFDGFTLTLTEKNPTERRHNIIFAGREVLSNMTGNFAINLSGFSATFDWNFEDALFRRLDIAEIDFDEKNRILWKLSQLKDFAARATFVQALENQALRESLYEIIFSAKSV